MIESASSNPLEEQSASAFDDGGPVDDETTGAIPETPSEETQPNTPEAQANDETFNQKVKEAGHAIYEGVLSIPQYLNLLMGKAGQYDQLWNNSTVKSITEAAKGVGQALNAPLDNPNEAAPPQRGRGASSPLMQGGLPGIGEGAAPDWGDAGKAVRRFGTALSQNFGAEGEPVETPTEAEAAGLPPAGTDATRRDYVPEGGGKNWANPTGQEPGKENTPATTSWSGYGAPDPKQLAEMFNVPLNVVMQARARYGSAAEAGQMLDYIASHADEQTKQKYAMEKAKAAGEWHIQNNQTTNATRVQIEQMKDAVTNTKTQTQALTALKVAAMRSGSAEDKNVNDRIRSYIANGIPIPDDLAAAGVNILTRSQAGGGGMEGEGASRGPIRITPGVNPNEQPQGKQVIYVNNKPYFADPAGKILGPATQ